jgi:hypothetical protein
MNMTHFCVNEYIEDCDDETKFNFQKKDRYYEWGFDLTDFNEEDEEIGIRKFKELLNRFNISDKAIETSGFEWRNKDESIIIVTANNPITGEYIGSCRDNEKGYLSYVGISCEKLDILKLIISEFRIRATFIKDEHNARIFI